MTTFLLIRHGQTDAIGKVMAGWQPGWHLNAAGKLQAERLAQRLSRLPIRAIFTSPLERAVETAAAIAEPLGLPFQMVDQLGELRVGEWEGAPFEQLEKQNLWRCFNLNRGSVRPPGGGLMIETQARMITQIEQIGRAHDGELVALVSHADPLRSVIAHVLGMNLDFLLRIEISPASVSILEWGGAGPRLIAINETGDIPL